MFVHIFTHKSLAYHFEVQFSSSSEVLQTWQPQHKKKA